LIHEEFPRGPNQFNDVPLWNFKPNLDIWLLFMNAKSSNCAYSMVTQKYSIGKMAIDGALIVYYFSSLDFRIIVTHRDGNDWCAAYTYGADHKYLQQPIRVFHPGGQTYRHGHECILAFQGHPIHDPAG